MTGAAAWWLACELTQSVRLAARCGHETLPGFSLQPRSGGRRHGDRGEPVWSRLQPTQYIIIIQYLSMPYI